MANKSWKNKQKKKEAQRSAASSSGGASGNGSVRAGASAGGSGISSGAGMSNVSNRSAGPVKPSRTTPYQGMPFAPYNFVPIWKETMPYQGIIPPHSIAANVEGKSVVGENLLSGEIEYYITTQKEISVGGAEDENGAVAFYRNSDNKYAIPGSTMRGLIRSNAQILSNSYVGDDIDLDSRFMYRDVAGTSEYSMRKEYEDILGSTSKVIDGSRTGILENVRCGYIENINGHYFLYGTMNDDSYGKKDPANYYVIRESNIHEKHNAHMQDRSKPDDFGWLFTNPPYRLQYLEGAVQLDVGFGDDEEVDYSKNHDANDEKKGGQMDPKYVNTEYQPFYIPIAYDLRTDKGGKKQVTRITDPTKAGCENLKFGYLLGSGFIEGKKALYVIPEINNNVENRTLIPDEDVRVYQADLKRKESILKSEKNGNVYDFYALPAEGESPKPVFYIRLSDTQQGKKGRSGRQDRYYLGFTPRLRIFYNNTVGAGFHQKRQRMDYAKALFGYTRIENSKTDKSDPSDLPMEYSESRKTRVSFSDAVIIESGRKLVEQTKTYILSSPKPTSYFDYIEQSKDGDKGVISYNGYLDCKDKNIKRGNGKFTIRGIKQYWNMAEPTPQSMDAGGEIASVFKTLPSGTQFRGTVRFHNLREEELGLLLWSLQLDGNSNQNIGKAKAYGYGTIKIFDSSIEIWIFDPVKAYSLDKLNPDPYINMTEEKDDWIALFRRVQEESGFGEDTDAGRSRDTFMEMKKRILPKKDDGWYMSIDAGDYQKRKDEHAPLPTVEEFVSKTLKHDNNGDVQT